MSESPFATVSRIINEPANISDDLRIIAGDHGRFTDEKRQILRNAAEELESWQRAYILLQADFIEAQRRLIAVNEQLIESRKSQPKWSMSGTISGTITPLTVPDYAKA